MLSDEEKFTSIWKAILSFLGCLVPKSAQCMQQSDHVWPRQAQDAFRRTASVSRWGAEFRNLMDHSKVLPYLIELIGPRVPGS